MYKNFITKIACRSKIKQIFEKILLQQDPEKQYSRFRYFMYHEFEFFEANDFEGKQKDEILKFFNLFKKDKL